MDMSFRPTAAAPISNVNILPVRTFSEAAASYIHHGGSDRYMMPIIAELGGTLLSDIHPFDVRQMAMRLYPDQKNATRNRCVITPVRAVMYHAYDRGWGPIIRLRNLKEEEPKRKKAASQAWLHAFVRQAEKDRLPHIAALILFMSQTGARVSEAIRLEWADIDLTGRSAILLRTKTETRSTRYLTDQLISRLYKLREGHIKGPVFRITNRASVNERIKAVCQRAGITYKSSHTCGRHAFANNALALGNDVKSTMVAGGWKSPAVFLGVYVNPTNAGRLVAERFNQYQYDADL